MTLKLGSRILCKFHKHCNQTSLVWLEHAVYSTLVLLRAHRSLCLCIQSAPLYANINSLVPRLILLHVSHMLSAVMKHHNRTKLSIVRDTFFVLISWVLQSA